MSVLKDQVVPGAEFTVPYPFVRSDYAPSDMDYETVFGWTLGNWDPGTRERFVPPDSSEAVADAMGAMVLNVVSVHRPALRYPARVFYTRKWRDPDGRTFGKRGLRIKTMGAFRRLATGFGYEFQLLDDKGDAA